MDAVNDWFVYCPDCNTVLISKAPKYIASMECYNHYLKTYHPNVDKKQNLPQYNLKRKMETSDGMAYNRMVILRSSSWVYIITTILGIAKENDRRNKAVLDEWLDKKRDE